MLCAALLLLKVGFKAAEAPSRWTNCVGNPCGHLDWEREPGGLTNVPSPCNMAETKKNRRTAAPRCQPSSVCSGDLWEQPDHQLLPDASMPLEEPQRRAAHAGCRPPTPPPPSHTSKGGREERECRSTCFEMYYSATGKSQLSCSLV